MITCPSCNHDNIQGADTCEECGGPLSEESLPRVSSSLERSVIKDPVAKMGTKEALEVPPTMPVSEVIQLLATKKRGCAVIVESGKLIGIFSDRDALIRINVNVAELGSHPVSEFMTAKPVTLESSSTIAFAVHKMNVGAYRHLPILDEGKIVGVISVRDILRYIAEDLLRMDTD